MKRTAIILVLSLLLLGCSSKSPTPDVKDFEKSYFVYQEGNDLVLQFLEDNSKLILTDKFISESEYDNRITNSAEDHLIFSDDHSKIIFPEYTSAGFGDYYMIDLRSSTPIPVLIDTNIDTEGYRLGKIVVNQKFDEFVYLKSPNASYSDIKLYKKTAKETVVLSEKTHGDYLIANSDFSKILYQDDRSFLHVYDVKEGDMQLSFASKPSSIMSYTNDFKTIIYRDGIYDATYHYIMDYKEFKFPENHLIYDRSQYAFIAPDGRIISISLEDSQYALKDVIQVNKRNSEIEDRMANGEKLKLTYVNIISPNTDIKKTAIASLLLEPVFSEVYESVVLVARPIDTDKLTNLKVNISDLGVNWDSNEIDGFVEFYQSEDVLLYQVDNNFKTIKMEGFDSTDLEYTGAYIDWLEQGSKIISISNRDSVTNDNQRFLNIYTLDKNASILNPELVTKGVCTYNVASYSYSNFDANEGFYIYEKSIDGDCDRTQKSTLYYEGEEFDETNNSGIIVLTLMDKEPEFIYLMSIQSVYNGFVLKLYTGDMSIEVSDRVEYYVSDRGEMVLYYINNSDDEYVDMGEIWYYNGSKTGLLIESCKKLFAVYNVEVK